MGLIVDTSVFIAAERGRFDLASFVLAEPTTDFAMSAISASELLIGVHRAKPAVIDARRLFVETLVNRFTVISFDLTAA